MNWLGDFFAAIPAVLVALWNFADGWLGVGVTVGSVVIIAVALAVAQRTRDDHGWISAVFGTIAATVASFWLFGILPSAWIYFADGSRDLLADTVIPSEIVLGEVTVMSNFYQVFRDSIVMAETTVAMVAMVVLALMVQKRYPRGLAEGEEKGPSSGGYK
jgi:FlaA1/EpsC-like NDP-sugar epimerase